MSTFFAIWEKFDLNWAQLKKSLAKLNYFLPATLAAQKIMPLPMNSFRDTGRRPNRIDRNEQDSYVSAASEKEAPLFKSVKIGLNCPSQSFGSKSVEFSPLAKQKGPN
jgi:hypothetical protein